MGNISNTTEYSEKYPFHAILSLLSDRWSLLMLSILFPDKRLRFHDLQEKCPFSPTASSLTRSLNALIRNGIVEKEVINGLPLRTEYHLTDFGCKFSTQVYFLGEWLKEHQEEFQLAQQLYDKKHKRH